MSRHVVVRIEGLVFDYRFNEEDLRCEFESFGQVLDVMLLDEELVPDVGIIEFAEKSAAESAVSKLNGSSRNVEGYSGILKVAVLNAAMERELLVKAHIVATGSDPFQVARRADRYVCKYVLGAINVDFSILGRIVGVGGENVKSIFRQTGAHVKVNGRAKSTEDPLHVRVSAESLQVLEEGKKLTEFLISETLKDLEAWCHKNYVAVPPVRVLVVQGSDAMRPLGRLVEQFKVA